MFHYVQIGIAVEHLQMICDELGITLKEFFDVDSNQDDFLGAIANSYAKAEITLNGIFEKFIIKSRRSKYSYGILYKRKKGLLQ